jgi:hypothetical protein
VPDGYPTSFGLGGVGEMLPSYENRISLNGRRTDKWGVPIAHIRCQLGDNDRILVSHQLRALREMTQHAGYQVNFIGSVLGLDSNKVWPDYDPLQPAASWLNRRNRCPTRGSATSARRVQTTSKTSSWVACRLPPI